jgi:transglutaminase-like putative cysteine protease
MRTLIFLIALSCLSTVNAQSEALLASLEVELDSKQTLPLTDKIRFELVSSKALEISKSLSNWQNINTKLIDEETLLVTTGVHPQFSGAIKNQYLADSFVIDNDEESTQRFVSGFARDSSKTIELDHLAAYISQYIDTPTYIHGFHIASKVANQRSGDCTEYAVLAVALARALEIPARVVIGTVILESSSKITAYGHAWAEVWKNDQWQILDAALYGDLSIQQFYLPAAALENEGPGFMMSLAAAANLMPSKITQLRSD